jgi:hypothetical protein
MCASGFAAVCRHCPRIFHTPTLAKTAKIPKKTPVNSSQSTPDSLTNGPHTASPKRLLPRFKPCPVRRTCEVVRAACCTSRTPELAAFVSVFVTVLVTGGASVEAAPAPAGVPAEAEGFGAVAASTAVTSVLAAARAPIPSARPNRTESIPQSVTVFPSWPAKSWPLQPRQRNPLCRIQHGEHERKGGQSNEKYSLADRRILRCCSGIYGLGTKTYAARRTSCAPPGRGLGRSSHDRLEKN